MTTGLILMGGGARAAYQVGVLAAVREILAAEGRPDALNPFDVICGTSAGAINAAALAAQADDFGQGIDKLVKVWATLRASDIYRTDLRRAGGNALHWVAALTLGWIVRTQPRSLFDNTPLAELLERTIDFGRFRRALAAGNLQALAITASSYTSGQHVTYYQSRIPVPPWSRIQRLSCETRIGVEHLLASVAIPFVFPAVSLPLDGRREYFGDGSIRQVAPISPAIHLGADRVLIVGAGRLEQGTPAAEHTSSQYVYPSLAQIAGHALSSIFLDGLANDIERLTRINRTIGLVPNEQRGDALLRPIEILAIVPSQRLDTLAVGRAKALPRTIRTILQMTGATDRRGAALVSYLLFESVYTGELIALGRSDTMARRDDVRAFFAPEFSEPSDAPAPPPPYV
ncbi:MAG: patatin-like phospholipase family protein [Burkholderiaceae bacterium]